MPPWGAAGTRDRRALYLRWRPQRFADVVGQDHVTRTLRNAVVRNCLAHAYLFTGPRGTGKTSVARILYRAANCEHPLDGDPDNRCHLCVAALEGRALDLVEIDAASNRGIDDIRDLRERVAYRPSQGRYRVYIVDEAHELTPQAWDAFLKTLEEPPEHVLFVLATTEAHKVPTTIISRCQRFDFRRISFEATRVQLARVAEAEGLTIDPAVVDRLARSARGGLRDALSLLDQLSAFAGARVDMLVARTVLGLPPAEAVQATIDSLGRRYAAGVMAQVAHVAEGGGDLRQFVEELTANLRAILLTRVKADASLGAEFAMEDLVWLRAQAPSWTVGVLIHLVEALTHALARHRDAQQFQTAVELALLAVCDEGSPVPAPVAGPLALDFVAPRPAPSGAAGLPSAAVPQPATPLTSALGGPPPGHEDAVSDRPPASEETRADRSASAATPVPTSSSDADRTPVRRAQVDGDDLSRVRERWQDVVDQVALKKNARVWLQTARPIRLESGWLTLAFDGKPHRTSAERNRPDIEAAVLHVTGRPYKIRCVSGVDDDSGSGPRSGYAADAVLSFAVSKFGGELRRVEQPLE